ncbi:MAG: hypothetical protein U0350_32750 [Caldilineaceae bacterium]
MLRATTWALFMYLLIKGLLLAVGIGVGLLLHWLMPAIELGMGVLIGVVTTGISVYFFTRLMVATDAVSDEEVEAELPPRITYLIDPLPASRRRKRKSS